MRITRGWLEVVVGIVVLALFLCVVMVVVDEKCSRDLELNDLVFSEWEDSPSRRDVIQESPLFPAADAEREERRP